MIPQGDNGNNELLSRLEGVSGQIQLLALNIAVAAAKIAHKQDLGLEVNQRLSQLVNQATQAVRQMNQILTLAGSSTTPQGNSEDGMGFGHEFIERIENSMESIISDSEKITHILSNIRKKEL